MIVNVLSAQTTFSVGYLNYQINDDGVSVTVTGHVDGQQAVGDLDIPETVFYNGVDYPVTIIGDYEFYNCYNLYEWQLVIPNSVITIGDCAFDGCYHFNGHLLIGNSVKHIGSL